MGESFLFSCGRTGCKAQLAVIRDDRSVAESSARSDGWSVSDAAVYCPAHNPEKDGLMEPSDQGRTVAAKSRKGKK